MTEKKKSFFSGLKAEWKKIQWPAQKDAAKQTVLVLIAVIIIAVLVRAWDFGVQQLLGLLTTIG